MKWNYEQHDPILIKLYKIDKLHDSTIASIMRFSRETIKTHRVRLGFKKCNKKKKLEGSARWDKPSKYSKEKEAKLMHGVKYD